MRSMQLNSSVGRLSTSLLFAFGLLFIGAAVHDEQLEVFGSPPYPLYLFRQVFYESVAHPFYLFVAVTPIAAAAWLQVGWIRLVAGGLPLLSTVLPYGAFEYYRLSNGELVGYHASLHQLASPQHEMGALLPGLLLITAGGIVSLAWRAGPGAFLSATGLVITFVGWSITERAGSFVIDDRALMSFPTSPLLFGYYIAWVGAITGLGASAWVSRKRRDQSS